MEICIYQRLPQQQKCSLMCLSYQMASPSMQDARNASRRSFHLFHGEDVCTMLGLSLNVCSAGTLVDITRA